MARPYWCEGCGDKRARVMMTTENRTTVWYCRDCAEYIAMRMPALTARLAREEAERERRMLAEWGTIGQGRATNTDHIPP